MFWFCKSKHFARVTSLTVGLLCTASSAFAGEIPPQLMSFFTKRPAVAAKNVNTQLATEVEKYDIAQALREDHVGKIWNDSKDHMYALRNLQFVLLIDRSGSMAQQDRDPEDKSNAPFTEKTGMLAANYWAQWDNAYKATKYLSESIFRFDADHKVPVIFFSSTVEERLVEDVVDLFKEFSSNKLKPRGETDLKGALALAFSKYARLSGDERTLFIVLTDGAPILNGRDQTSSEIENLIYEKMTKIDPQGEHLNLLFVRMGDEEKAKTFLNTLDTSTLIGASVDHKSDNMIYKMGPENLFLNAMFEHLDKDPRYAE